MNRPPPLSRIFSCYFRALLVAMIASVAVLILAGQRDWPLPVLIQEIAREHLAPRIAPTPPGR